MKTFRRIVKKLTDEHLTISTMESCTGGGVANAITSMEGASSVFKFAAVTYSNEYKIKMGVSKDIIDKYSVYSMETAREMARAISVFDEADIGIGITGKLNRADVSNNFGKDNEVFISIFFDNMYYDKSIIVDKKTRKQNKELVINTIIEGLGEILWKEK